MAKKKTDSNAPVTFNMLQEAIDAILAGVQRMIDVAKQELRGEFKGELGKLRKEMKTEFGFVRDDINGLKGELALKVDRSEIKN